MKSGRTLTYTCKENEETLAYTPRFILSSVSLSFSLPVSLPLPVSKSAARMDVIIVIKPVCNGLCWPGFCYANAERLEACCRAARSNLFSVSWGEHTLGILHPSHEVRSAPTLHCSTHAPALCVCVPRQLGVC